MIVGDQRLDAIKFRCSTNIAGIFAVVAAEADNLKAQLLAGDTGCGDSVGTISEDEHPLAREIVRVDRTAPPRQTRQPLFQHGFRIDTGQFGHFTDKILGRTDADWHGAHGWLTEFPFQIVRRKITRFRIQNNIEIGLTQPGDIGGTGTKWCGDIDINAHLSEQACNLDDIVPMPEAERCRSEQINQRTTALLVGRT